MTPRAPPIERAMVFGEYFATRSGSALASGDRLVRRVEEPLHVLFRVADDGGSDEAGRAGVGEDEDVAAADVGARRGDELGERVVVELLGDDDPHADAVGAHHGEEHLVAAREPAFADGDLPGHRERRRRRRGGLCRGLRRGGSGQEQEEGGSRGAAPGVAARAGSSSHPHLALAFCLRGHSTASRRRQPAIMRRQPKETSWSSATSSSHESACASLRPTRSRRPTFARWCAWPASRRARTTRSRGSSWR